MEAQLTAGRIENCTGDAYAAGVSKPFQPSSDVHPVAVGGTIGFLDDVPEMHADPKSKVPVLSRLRRG
jgi:hypothetical protein